MDIEMDDELTGIERAQLSVMVTDAGFAVLQKLMKNAIKRFNIDLINSNKPDDVILKHQMAKSAAQFYIDVLNRIQTEVDLYHATPQKGDKPVDPTEGIIDLDDVGEQIAHLPNLLEAEG